MFISEKQREYSEDEIECDLSFRDIKKSKCWEVWSECCVCLSKQFQFCLFLQRGLWGWMELPSPLPRASVHSNSKREQHSASNCYSNPHNEEWGRAKQEGGESFNNLIYDDILAPAWYTSLYLCIIMAVIYISGSIFLLFLPVWASFKLWFVCIYHTSLKRVILLHFKQSSILYLP